MPFMPFQIIGLWLRGLLALALIGLGLYCLREWYERSHVIEVPEIRTDAGQAAEGAATPRRDAVPEGGRRVFAWRPGLNEPTAFLAAGALLLAWSFAGLPITRAILRLRYPSGPDEPRSERGGEVRRLRRPDGSELQVELYGPPDAPPIVLTHGWGANGTEWYYVKKALADRYRLIVWDLPGLGLSTRPGDDDYSLENLARDLDAVLALAGDRPAILAGHSIGGMIILTYCRLFPGALAGRVAGLVLVHTTYTNPVRTTKWAGLYTALQKPLIEPLLHVTIWLSPLVWLMNALQYLNGSAHTSNARQVFAGTETYGQLDFASRFLLQGWPSVLARGMFGMLRYDATDTLKSIGVPTLVVAGDLDITTKPEASERIRSDVPAAEQETLTPARHMGLIEHHDRFNAVLDAFAARCGRVEAAR